MKGWFLRARVSQQGRRSESRRGVANRRHLKKWELSKDVPSWEGGAFSIKRRLNRGFRSKKSGVIIQKTSPVLAFRRRFKTEGSRTMGAKIKGKSSNGKGEEENLGNSSVDQEKIICRCDLPWARSAT